ncbi:MAG: hypothetical protein LBM65_03640 [Oscillospiraceae bacterium]|jgi:hypothetical protein|nr:hypothetical protein [Oscillospiraceae bacterium]
MFDDTLNNLLLATYETNSTLLDIEASITNNSVISENIRELIKISLETQIATLQHMETITDVLFDIKTKLEDK